jgi:hypothetical protein
MTHPTQLDGLSEVLGALTVDPGGRLVSSSAVAILIGLLVAGMRRSKIAIS